MIVFTGSSEDVRLFDLLLKGGVVAKDICASYKCHFCPSMASCMSPFVDRFDVSKPDAEGKRWLMTKMQEPSRYTFTCETCKEKMVIESYKSKYKGGF